MQSKLKNIDEAVNIIIESSKKHAAATETGDYKIANKNYHLIKKAVDYLMQTDEVQRLCELLDYDNASDQVWVASFLIKYDNQKAVNTLELIASQSIPHHSFDTKMVLQEWRKGKLK